jgi:hypothetical protein
LFPLRATLFWKIFCSDTTPVASTVEVLAWLIARRLRWRGFATDGGRDLTPVEDPEPAERVVSMCGQFSADCFSTTAFVETPPQ